MVKSLIVGDKINKDQEDEMIILGYVPSLGKTILLYLMVILSGGLLLLLLSWKPSIRIRWTSNQCALKDAHKVLLLDSFEQQYIEKVVRKDCSPAGRDEYQYFFHKKLKYIWNRETQHYVKLEGLDVVTTDRLHRMDKGLTGVEAAKRLEHYEKNSIFVDVKPIHVLIFLEVKSPFYLYQLFIVIVWLGQGYYQFGICVFFLSVISISATVWETRKQSISLRDAVQSQSFVTVLRDGIESHKSSHELVPGDILILREPGMTLECDAILLSGSCVVNESMLTGESIPITKVPIVDDESVNYVANLNKKNTLFCGTKVLHSYATDSPTIKAVVYRTAFNTVKGELVRSILFPMPVAFKMYKELFICMIIFLMLGIPAMIYTAIVFHHLGAPVNDIVLIVVDVATFVVPPLLPAVFTSINAHAQRRLRKHEIFCLNSRYINFCGGLDLVCFDKTGTLTEDSLDLSGVVPSRNGKFQGAIKDVHNLPDSPLVVGMATCHSLNKVDGELLGYTLDIKMFQAINWVRHIQLAIFEDYRKIPKDMDQPDSSTPINFERLPLKIVGPKKEKNDGREYAILREFPFESLLQRMTVVTKLAGASNLEVYIKGAPEVIASLSRKDTVPENFKEILEMYTRQGFRVLAIGYRPLAPKITWEDAMRLTREHFEKDIEFEGLLVLQNHLKLETIPALKILKNANIRTIMVTGDNLLTGSSVAAECGMVDENDSIVRVEAEFSHVSHNQLKVWYSYLKFPGYSERLNVGQNGELHVPLIDDSRFHFAMDGKTFELLRKNDPALLRKIVQRSSIFARMLPEQKRDLVIILQQLGHMVGMCGDGANDCGALKAAHAGVSLSMEEASVASPFTSKQQNIMCFPTVIREGRAALTSTFGAFRYMVCYCFVLLAAVLFIFWDGQKPSDGCYVIIDIVLSLLPPIVFGSTQAYEGLAKRPPNRSILSFVQMFSMTSFFVIQLLVYYATYVYCMSQPWYEPFLYNHHRTHKSEASHLGTSILTVNMMSYVIASVIFAPGPPYRKNLLSNRPYLAIIVLQFLLVTYVSLYPAPAFRSFMNFKFSPHMDYHVVLYAISLANFILCYIWEAIVIQYFLFEKIMPLVKKVQGPVEEYEKIDAEIDANKDTWPPIGQTEEQSRKHASKVVPRSSIGDESDVGAQRRRKDKTMDWSSFKMPQNNAYENPREQPLTFVTFRDGSHQVANKNNLPSKKDDSIV